MTPSLVAVSLGLGLLLSMSCGLRAFVAPFLLACAQGLGWVELGPDLHWLGTPLAIGAFGAAIVLELLADKIPVLDHLMDVLHTALKPASGALVAYALARPDEPVYAAVAALVGGGVVAGGTHVAKALVRVGSTSTTAGVGNPVLSIVEDLVAIGLASGLTYAAHGLAG